MKRQKIHVSDPSADDFGTASRHVKAQPVDHRYRYRHRNPAWQLASALLYYVIAPAPIWLIAQWYGVRFRNRAAIRRQGGCYIYGNHTHFVDIMLPYLLAFPRRAYVVAGPTAFAIPVVRQLVAMLGGVPLNSTLTGKKAFRARLTRAVERGQVVAILPEAHLWPYYNGIRDFPAYSFSYPVHDRAPVIGYVVTYRARRWRASGRPRLTVSVSEPILPNSWAASAEAKQLVRDQVHQFMCDTVVSQASQRWIEYDLPEPD